MSELVIDESNFDKYFRDVKTSSPQKGDVMAVYRASAELTAGQLKEQIVNSLCSEDIGARKAVQLAVKLARTSRKEAIKLVKQICSDLYGGMPKGDVIAKSYRYIFEMFFYTKKDYVPTDDKHWEVITFNNIDDFIEKSK